jgi:hypothetical protein
MGFDEHGNFVRRPNVDNRRAREIREQRERALREVREKECRHHILTRLLNSPGHAVEAQILWKELEELYKDVWKAVVEDLVSWAVVKPKFIYLAQGQRKLFHCLNVYHDCLTYTKSVYYFPEIAKAVEAIIEEERKKRTATSKTGQS